MGNAKAAIENLKKAHKSPLIGKRGKHKSTIEKEKARDYYLEQLGLHFADITEAQFKAAKNAKNGKERMYVVDQMIGKPKETIAIEGNIELSVDI